jgi:putative two-component system response regulator
MNEPLDFTRQDTVLVVDDSPADLTLMSSLLSKHYKTRLANGAARGLELAATAPLPDLVLLDIEMPDMDGYEVCRRLKADPTTSAIPVIFLTSKNSVEDEQKGFDAGCVDYITKPASGPIVLARARTHLLLKGARDFLNDQKAYLEAEIVRRSREATFDATSNMRALARKVEDLSAAMRERDIDPALLHTVDQVSNDFAKILHQSAGPERS